MDAISLIVGLGNPGEKYRNTRHNLGFEVVDRIAASAKLPEFKRKSDALLTEGVVENKRIIILKPQTFMNLSGRAIQPVLNFYKIDPRENLLVVYDDLDLPAGTNRLRKSGGSGGHNGIRSIIQEIGTEDFKRIRIGIGRSAVMDAENFVLAKMEASDRALFDRSVESAVKAVNMILGQGMDIAMNYFNVKAAGVADGS